MENDIQVIPRNRHSAPTTRRALRNIPALTLAVGGLVSMSTGIPAAYAQSAPPQLPGLIVSVPTGPQAPPPGMAISTPPSPGAPEPAPQAKPKAAPTKSANPKTSPTSPKATRSRQASADPGDGAGGGRSLGIAVFVNDDIITDHEITQRAKLLSMSTNIAEAAKASFKALAQSESTSERLKAILQETIEANRGKSREEILAIFEQRRKAYAQGLQQQAVASARSSVLPKLRKEAREELIDERLKLQEAKALGISIDETRIDDTIKVIAQRNNMTPDQFGRHLAGIGGDLESMKSRFRASMVWMDVIRRRYSALISVNEADVDRFVTTGEDAEDRVEFKLHRITVPTPKKIDQRSMAQLFDQADSLRRNFKGCASTAAVASTLPGARFEDLGTRTADKLAEPTRSILLNAKDGEMAPPAVASSGIELYAVCSRDVTKANEERRNKAAQELQTREFEMHAKRHLLKLRQSAQIRTR